MAKTTTSKKTNAGVAKKSTTAAKKAAVEQTETVNEVETGAAAENVQPAAAVEQTETKEETTEDTDGQVKSVYPFNTNPDGTVNVWSERRAGKSVIGTTGDIVTFDADGLAKVKLEDALHFAKVPGFNFKK